MQSTPTNTLPARIDRQGVTAVYTRVAPSCSLRRAELSPELGDANALEYAGATFDVVVNNFMFDLLPEQDFATVFVPAIGAGSQAALGRAGSVGRGLVFRASVAPQTLTRGISRGFRRLVGYGAETVARSSTARERL